MLEGPLELDADAAARGVSERLLGLVGEVVVLETVHEEQSGCSEKASLSAGADKQASTWGVGAPQRGHGAPLEPLADLGDALRSVGAGPPQGVITKPVIVQAAMGRVVSMGADRKANTQALWFERQTAYSSDCSVELPLRPSTRAAAALGPRLWLEILRAGGEECQWALTQKRMLSGGGAP